MDSSFVTYNSEFPKADPKAVNNPCITFFQTTYNLKFPRNIHFTKAIYFFLQLQNDQKHREPKEEENDKRKKKSSQKEITLLDSFGYIFY